MTVLVYRLWNKCSLLEPMMKNRHAYNYMAYSIASWFFVAILPLFAILFFPEQLGGFKPFFLILNVLIGGTLILSTIGSLILEEVYGAYQARLGRYLCGAYESVGLMTCTGVRAKLTEEAEKELEQWMTIPLPMKRKWALIQAHIKPSQALSPEMRRLSLQDLSVTAALFEVRPSPPEKYLGHVDTRIPV